MTNASIQATSVVAQGAWPGANSTGGLLYTTKDIYRHLRQNGNVPSSKILPVIFLISIASI